MLQTVLNIIMFEDCRNQWSMSRPLLGLILLNEEVGCSYAGRSLSKIFLKLIRTLAWVKVIESQPQNAELGRL